jgi:predicted MFS family arabinose efflux permease
MTPLSNRSQGGKEKSVSEHNDGRYVLRISNLYTSGLIVSILVILQAFLGLTTFDFWIETSVITSALALPLLAGMLVVNAIEEHYPSGPASSLSKKLMHLCSAAGTIAALIAIDTSFWHVLWQAGLAFALAALIALCIYGWYVAQLEEKPIDPAAQVSH